jgi:hypothetical protein
MEKLIPSRYISWLHLLSLAIFQPCKLSAAAPVPAFRQPGIKLDRQWKSALHPAGTGSAQEIGMLVGEYASASEDFSKKPNITIYRNITYLAPMKSIERELKQMVLKTSVAPRPLNTPGFPSYSLRIYAFDPKDPKTGFDGYDRMHVIVDKADQVVAVELTTEIPSKAHPLRLKSNLYKTWDFANNVTKAISIAEIEHETSQSNGLIEIRSSFLCWLTRSNYYGRNLIPLKESKLFLPIPLGELILTCVETLKPKKST